VKRVSSVLHPHPRLAPSTSSRRAASSREMIPPTLVSLRAPLPGPVLVLPSSAAPDERVRAEAAAVTRARRTPSALATPHKACVRSRTRAHSSAPARRDSC
jgi:hypothetical protein